jgi:hypothetical protein
VSGTPPKLDFYGRPVKIPVDVSPLRLRGIALSMLALGVLMVLVGLSRMSGDPRGLFVTVVGTLLVPLSGWALWGSFMAARRPPLFVRLGLRTLAYPRGPVAWQLDEEEVRLADLRGVGVFSNRGVVCVELHVPDGGRQAIQAAWLKGWSHIDFALLVQLRMDGALRKLDRAQQAGLEALVFEGEGMLGAVVDTRKKRPRVIALVADLDEYDALLGEKSFPHANHRVVVAADQVDSVRDAIEARMLAALDVGGFRVPPRR